MPRILVVLAATLIWATTALAQDKTLELAATEWPPFYGKDLENGGFVTEIIDAAFARAGYAINIKFLPWKRALEETKSGKFDGLFTVWYRDERKEFFVFSRPLPANEVGFYRQAGSEISYTGYDDLKPYTIGVVRGYANPPGFDEAGLKIHEVKDDETNLRLLAKGRVDLVLTDKLVGRHIINTTLAGAGADFEWLEPPLKVETQHLVFSKKAENHEAVAESFDTALQEIRADGTLAAIMAKHGFSSD